MAWWLSGLGAYHMVANALCTGTQGPHYLLQSHSRSLFPHISCCSPEWGKEAQKFLRNRSEKY